MPSLKVRNSGKIYIDHFACSSDSHKMTLHIGDVIQIVHRFEKQLQQHCLSYLVLQCLMTSQVSMHAYSTYK